MKTGPASPPVSVVDWECRTPDVADVVEDVDMATEEERRAANGWAEAASGPGS
jgi:hypothetical protein